jgi:hypothetical protein
VEQRPVYDVGAARAVDALRRKKVSGRGPPSTSCSPPRPPPPTSLSIDAGTGDKYSPADAPLPVESHEEVTRALRIGRLVGYIYGVCREAA